MKYSCSFCSYETDDKGNWAKHKKSKKHNQKSNTWDINTTDFIEKAPKKLPNALERAESATKSTTKSATKKRAKSTSIEKKYICDECNIEFSKSFNLSRHLKTCKRVKENNDLTLLQKEFTFYKQTIENEMKIKLLEEKIKIAEEKAKSAEEKMKSAEEKVKNVQIILKEQINILKTENTFHKQLINSAGGLIGKSMNAMSYLLLNHNNAPTLKPLEDYSIISKDEESLIKNLIYHHRKKTIKKYIGDFLVEQYKKDNPNLQAIWSSDTERVNYFIRELTKTKDNNIKEEDNKNKIVVNKKNNKLMREIEESTCIVIKTKKNEKYDSGIWSIDKKGIKVIESIIEPLLQYIQKIGSKYINDKSKEIEYMKINDAINVSKDMQDIGIIICGIKNKSIALDINKYIAPHFYLNKSENPIIF